MNLQSTIVILVCISMLLLLLLGLVRGESEQVFYDWVVSFTTLAPLGVEKQVIVINDQFPGPTLYATTNDVVNINIHNNLTDPFLMTWNGVQLRRNSWQDGVQETNCPILPGQNWTYNFQVKDQIGSFFYFPSLLLQKAAGGYGAIRVNNRVVIPIPFLPPYKELDVLIGDWYNADHRDLRASLDVGDTLPNSDGILINGAGPRQTVFDFEPGSTYRLRISNVGLKTSLNFRIQDHVMLLVETEGSYTLQQYYDYLDIHVGQSYSVLVIANKNQTSGAAFYMIASSLYTSDELVGVGIIRYPDSEVDPFGPFPPGPDTYDYLPSLWQARSIRWDLSVGAARPNPQGSYHYGSINISCTIVLENGIIEEENMRRYTVNGVSFVHPSTPLKLADYFQLTVPYTPPSANPSILATSVIDAPYRDYFHIIFQNPLTILQTWHLDGYNFFVVGMDYGLWNESMMEKYNMIDAISRSTVQVYPLSWTAILVKLDNRGIWNLRSQNAENWYLGQELYIRVHGAEGPRDVSSRDEAPIPENVIMCGRVSNLNHTFHH